MGAKFVLTEQQELVKLLNQNLKANFDGDDKTTAVTFSWERSRARNLVETHPGGFDLILCCD